MFFKAQNRIPLLKVNTKTEKSKKNGFSMNKKLNRINTFLLHRSLDHWAIEWMGLLAD